MSWLTKYVRLQPGQVLVNGRPWDSKVEAWPTDADSFVRKLYTELNMSYRKVFKMDLLSQLGLLGAELLLHDMGAMPEPDRVGMSLANAGSSMHTDRQFYQTIREPSDFHPSPALFVYTLPNIVIGEICIRQGFTGAHIFQIIDGFQADRICYFADELLRQDRADACLCGWVEPGPPFELFLYWVSAQVPKDGSQAWPHQPERIEALFKNV